MHRWCSWPVYTATTDTRVSLNMWTYLDTCYCEDLNNCIDFGCFECVLAYKRDMIHLLTSPVRQLWWTSPHAGNILDNLRPTHVSLSLNACVCVSFFSTVLTNTQSKQITLERELDPTHGESRGQVEWTGKKRSAGTHRSQQAQISQGCFDHSKPSLQPVLSGSVFFVMCVYVE